ncbi:MAG: arsinothricin resistance N-acetyltransferase ArsN1 family B [Chthoniobacteraceae bacterium]
MIRSANLEDAPAVARIYNHYVEKTVVSFEDEPVSVEEMRSRMREKLSAYPWLVAEEVDQVVGYAYAGKWNVRSAYRYAVESSVYLDPEHVGQGVGSRLYQVLLDDLRARSVHCVIGGVALPNDASVALHEKFGFQKVAHYREVGWKMDRWIDVGYWELLL